jgi:hypothetical protein
MLAEYMTMAGWFCLRRHLLFALSAVNTDRDEDGNYLIFGEPIVVGIDPRWSCHPARCAR